MAVPFSRLADIIEVSKKEMDELAASDTEPLPKNWLHKIWLWIA